MNAEIAKLRFLPTPRYIALAVLGICVVTGAVLFIVGPDKPDNYTDSSSVALAFATSIPIAVLGVWIVALEFASGTLQRTLTAESNRNRVLASKLILCLAVAIVLCVAAAATSGGLASLAADRSSIDIDRDTLARAVFGAVPAGVATIVVGFSFGLLTRSMGGGIALAAVFLFVLDGLLSFVPGVKEIAYGRLTADLTNHLAGSGDTDHSVGVAILGIVVWLIVILIPGWLYFLKGDLK